MPGLPLSTEFTGSTVTEGQFKTALTNLRDYLNGLLGADGLPATARTALGVSQNINEVVLGASTTLNATTHFGKSVVFGVAGLTATLPNPTTAGNGWWCRFVLAAGIGSANIARGGASDLIYVAGGSTAGVASLALPGTGPTSQLWNCNSVLLVCNGTHWRVLETDAAHGTQLFTSSGSWVCPQGVTKVLVSGAGGGGGGAYDANIDSDGGDGGDGARLYRSTVSVTPGTTYSVQIGAGGAGAGTVYGNGSAGGTTSLGVAVTIAGGSAGQVGQINGADGAVPAYYPQPAGNAIGTGGTGAGFRPGAAVAGLSGFLQLEW